MYSKFLQTILLNSRNKIDKSSPNVPWWKDKLNKVRKQTRKRKQNYTQLKYDYIFQKPAGSITEIAIKCRQ